MKSSSSSHIGSQFTQLCLLICILSLGVQAQKIKVEYDKDLDFSH
jgi:hypothetical protein